MAKQLLFAGALSGALLASVSLPLAHAERVENFVLARSRGAIPIVVSASDFAGVQRAARDLRDDVKRVSGAQPSFMIDSVPRAAEVVIIGTVGRSAIIDRLVHERKLDVSGISGKWESYTRAVVANPVTGVAQALVIAGSDKRGTIYGIYDVSSAIGVSPWYWWADVTPIHRDEVSISRTTFTSHEPAVKYRGIFINDEAPAFSGWAREKFGGVNHRVYEKMFELILRMRGNYLWPAMWGNAFADDDSLSARLADEYGIVMGTSHHEPMTRAQQEWKRYGSGEWDYGRNDATLRAFWRQGIVRMWNGGQPRENIVTVGMRGDGDRPMTTNGESNVAMLERIVADQRQIIGDVTGKDPSQTPQLWALYKEVQDYYDKGMRVPDDVTLLFADDNWGNIRRLPKASERNRSGGFGVYYHFDYVGGPRNYKWINTNPIGRVWEQLHLAHEYGADRIWIVNVGDLKPMEFPIQFFLDYAFDPSAIPAERLPEYTQHWIAQQFGQTNSERIASVVTRYLKYAARRKPELLAPETYSLANYQEAERVVAEYAALRVDAQALEKGIPAQLRDAYYQLVLHPVLAAENINALYYAVAKNRVYAGPLQTRASANDEAAAARLHFDNDAAISNVFNTQLAQGKWAHMMDQTHIGYTYWQEPPRNMMPRVDVLQVPDGAEMGVSYEGQNFMSPALDVGGQPVFGPRREIALPEFDVYAQQTYWIDVYNKRAKPFAFSIDTRQPWVHISESSGTVARDRRVMVSIDWSAAPYGQSKVPITVNGPNGSKYVIQANVRKPASPRREQVRGFVESNGYVAMEAEHYTSAVAPPGFGWLTIPDLGRTLSGVTATPVTSAAQTPGGRSSHLEYRVTTNDSGAVSVRAFLSPTLNFLGSSTGVRYAISIDDEPPQVMNIWADSSERAWSTAVSDNTWQIVSKHSVAKPGEHLVKFWMVDPGVVLQRLVLDFGGVKPSYLGPPESFSNSAGTKPALHTHAADPRFDWFEYAGDDSIYKITAKSAGQVFNPILPGFYPDPTIAGHNGDYYLVTSSFAYFPGLPIFHSRDLTHWMQVGHVLDRASQLPLTNAGISRGLFAPAISYNAANSTWYLINTNVDNGGNFFVTARNPAGPWSEPTWLQFDGIDPSFFFDDNGKAYVVSNGPPAEVPRYQGHRAIWIQEFDVAAGRMTGPRSLIVNGGVDLTKNPIWIEAPHIFRRNGFYYLICAEGGTADQHSEVVFRSHSTLGPWVPFENNPILTQRHLGEARPFPVTSTGHAEFVDAPDGNTWAVFLGTRPYTTDTYNIGRETFLLPVKWENDWPVILPGRETVPWVVGPVGNAPRIKMGGNAVPNGNFSIRDDFDDAKLPQYWQTIRGPSNGWLDVASSRGSLTLHARSVGLAPADGIPSWVGRRQQHMNATATTAMHYTPQHVGDKAGIMAMQNDEFYFFLAVERTQKGVQVVVERKGAPAGENAQQSIIGAADLETPPGSPVYLRIAARGGRYDFMYATRPGVWIPLVTDADGTILSTKVAKGFVGTMFALYAFSPEGGQ